MFVIHITGGCRSLRFRRMFFSEAAKASLISLEGTVIISRINNHLSRVACFAKQWGLNNCPSRRGPAKAEFLSLIFLFSRDLITD